MIIAFNDGTCTKATLEVNDNGNDQVVIRFIPYGEEHITLHLNPDGSIVGTHYKEDKEKSVWDDLRVEVARRMGIQRPERHGNYFIHTPLPKISNVRGYDLGGRLIDLVLFTPRAHYSNNVDHTFSSGFTKFLLKIYLSTADNPRPRALNKVATSLGDICFEFERGVATNTTHL
jgi:hypothetical protein